MESMALGEVASLGLLIKALMSAGVDTDCRDEYWTRSRQRSNSRRACQH